MALQPAGTASGSSLHQEDNGVGAGAAAADRSGAVAAEGRTGVSTFGGMSGAGAAVESA